MTAIFVSHVEEDKGSAIELAHGLEAAGLKTWYYERDCTPGPSYLWSITNALEGSDAVLGLISVDAFRSHIMESELIYAYEMALPLVPALLGVTHAEFQAAKPKWRFMFGAATSISVQANNVTASVSSIVTGMLIGADGKHEQTEPKKEVGPEHAPLAVTRQTLEHVLSGRLGAGERDVVQKALQKGVDELSDADLLGLLHALVWSGTFGLSPDGLLVLDAAMRIVARLARSGQSSRELCEAMARLLARSRVQAWSCQSTASRESVRELA